MRTLSILLVALSPVLAAAAQVANTPPQAAVAEDTPTSIVIPAGTRVPLALQHSITTKSARVGDRVYLQSTFPVTLNDRVVIPAGTYVQGEISSLKRPGRVKGRAELLMHFTTLIFPNGYTVSLPGSVENVPGTENSKMKERDKEGTIQGDSNAGAEVATVGASAATGTLVGGLSHGGKGAGIGAAAGAGAGLIGVLLTRGPEVRLEPGTTVEMVLQRPLTLEERKLSKAARQYVPVNREQRLERPQLTPPPDTR